MSNGRNRVDYRFQHTAARRRLGLLCQFRACKQLVSTHSRPKAAGQTANSFGQIKAVSTHSRPKAAGHDKEDARQNTRKVSTHSRPKAAGRLPSRRRPPMPFQHTAARRRLVDAAANAVQSAAVSTHSRPKAAGCLFFVVCLHATVSTHSRPKAAGALRTTWRAKFTVSTHSRPKAAGSLPKTNSEGL